MRLIAGSRGSKLAIAQTNEVIKKLNEKHKDLYIEIKIIKTKGDKILDRSIDKIGDKGIFINEIERELLDGEIDFAVHSLKDMPSKINEGLKILPPPERQDPRDVLIVNPKHEIEVDSIFSWLKNKKNLKVATGSKRREAQLLKINKDIKICPIRGNIDTRIKKLVDEDFDAIVLAQAGLNRLGIKNLKTHVFEIDEMIPAVAQGVLGIEVKCGSKVEKLFESIEDEYTDAEIRAERSFLLEIDGGCNVYVGANARIYKDEILLEAMYGDEVSNVVYDSLRGEIKYAESIGCDLAKKIRKVINDSRNKKTKKIEKK